MSGWFSLHEKLADNRQAAAAAAAWLLLHTLAAAAALPCGDAGCELGDNC